MEFSRFSFSFIDRVYVSLFSNKVAYELAAGSNIIVCRNGYFYEIIRSSWNESCRIKFYSQCIICQNSSSSRIAFRCNAKHRSLIQFYE